MNWINVIYSSNQKYVVKEKAIIQAINHVFNEIKNSEMINPPRLIFDEKHFDVEISLDVKVKEDKENTSHNTVKEISIRVERAVKNLINKNPKNVQICLLDFSN